MAQAGRDCANIYASGDQEGGCGMSEAMEGD